MNKKDVTTEGLKSTRSGRTYKAIVEEDEYDDEIAKALAQDEADDAAFEQEFKAAKKRSPSKRMIDSDNDEKSSTAGRYKKKYRKREEVFGL